MRDEELQDVLRGYGIEESETTFIRHNENRTYKVDEVNGSSYLLRIHQPVKDSMAGLQHTYEGLQAELNMLEGLSSWSNLHVQKPLRNRDGELITIIQHEGKTWNSSVLTWLEGRDLQKDDVKDPAVVERLGAHIAELHRFYSQHQQEGLDKRPSQGTAYHEYMIEVIKRGLEKGLFTSSDVSIIETTLRWVNTRLEDRGSEGAWGLIHGDLSLGNIIMTPEGEFSFIDFGFFGPGYYYTDVAMGAMMIPSEHRDLFLRGYYGDNITGQNELVLLEGFMLVAIIGYYVFQMENESVHAWMRERMPKLCADYCIPYLSGERIFYIV
ncbi:aminoglycoside phosphotransferase family protein [Paenibacillus glucanolyticus]|jgi:Ser/Thr protein kinase RdoA (MazF antagonist)|uniref:phosphotransferase enzyme family protein n=1 Tax=Paenibacillus TaxID=44249 RepID=UPI0003E285BB|nr:MULTISPECIES: phosphotransferase [Paenibacillus]ANA82481.1 aminoglycoside phosphotransferase [Paenibacillus glucanolyticus]AVV58778.1 aminoglycoside phosphotransferase family protein [Paenibacillus glucanolyticus]ETT33808.1 aminoglycoside phosphotransferase [Paenibacillus sp. FSL R5-808]